MPQSQKFKNLGAQIRALREKADLSINRLAALSSLSPEYIGKIERNTSKNVGIVTLGKIAKVFGIETYELLKSVKSEFRTHE